MIDRYTKTVLTTIAAALTVLVVQNAIQPSSAQDTVRAVVICDNDGDCLDLVPMDLAGETIAVPVVTVK